MVVSSVARLRRHALAVARGYVNIERMYDADRARYERLVTSGVAAFVWMRLVDATEGDFQAASELLVEARQLRTVRMDYACGHWCVKVVPVSVLDLVPGFYRAGVSARCATCEAVPESTRDAYWQVITRVSVDGHALAWDTFRLACGHSLRRERRADRPVLDLYPRRCESCECVCDVVGVSTVSSGPVAA